MNERIKELKKLATEVEHSHGAFGEYEKHYRLNTEKFAELIVRECLNIIGEEKCGVEVSNNLAPLETLWSVECAIKENFGIEE